MAFVYCHSCDWEQDDFWSLFSYYDWKSKKRIKLGYNPIRCLIDDFKSWWKPGMIGFDEYAAKDMGIKYVVKKEKISDDEKIKMWVPEGYTKPEYVESCYVHRWSVLWFEIKRQIRKPFRQHWWTEKAWKNDPKQWTCPRCGKEEIHVD